MSTQKNGDSPFDYQVGGDHYRGMKVQPIEVIHEYRMHFAEGSAFKYISRWRKKGGIQDLEKAKQCLRFAKREPKRKLKSIKIEDFLDFLTQNRTLDESLVLKLIIRRDFDGAIQLIDKIIYTENGLKIRSSDEVQDL